MRIGVRIHHKKYEIQPWFTIIINHSDSDIGSFFQSLIWIVEKFLTLAHVKCPSDRDVNWRPPVQGQSSPVQVKDPYTGSILMLVGSSCKQTGVYNVHLPRKIRN